EAGGEPAVIQPVEEGSFDHAGCVFFAGSCAFTRTNLNAALRTAAKIIDLSGAVAEREGTVAWFPKLDWLRGREFDTNAKVFAVPSAIATAAAGLALALSRVGLRRIMVTGFEAVSEAGRAGIEELESQTGQLLSFQGVGQPVYDTQVAFNMLDRFGPGSSHKLSATRERVRAETRASVDGKSAMPAIQVVHAPVFYGAAFSATGVFDPGSEAESIAQACLDAGFSLPAEAGDGPSNVSVAGEKTIHLSTPEQDGSNPETWWFWGAADNIRLPAANAVKLAEMLL
ncbi:MAG: Asd/ArgC dimerization domain-containing protein, partial [Candidatus Acidiferrum sp.]